MLFSLFNSAKCVHFFSNGMFHHDNVASQLKEKLFYATHRNHLYNSITITEDAVFIIGVDRRLQDASICLGVEPVGLAELVRVRHKVEAGKADACSDPPLPGIANGRKRFRSRSQRPVQPLWNLSGGATPGAISA